MGGGNGGSFMCYRARGRLSESMMQSGVELFLCSLFGGLSLSQVCGSLLCLLPEGGICAGLFCGGFCVAHLVHVLSDGFSVHVFLNGGYIGLVTLVFGFLSL